LISVAHISSLLFLSPIGTAGTTGAALGTAANAATVRPVDTVEGAAVTTAAGTATGVVTGAVAVSEADKVRFGVPKLSFNVYRNCSHFFSALSISNSLLELR